MSPRKKTAAKTPKLKCAHCGERAAACVGRYEGHGPVSPACNTCCGHGNEDGWCVAVENVAEWLRRAGDVVTDLEERVDEAQAESAALRAPEWDAAINRAVEEIQAHRADPVGLIEHAVRSLLRGAF